MSREFSVFHPSDDQKKIVYDYSSGSIRIVGVVGTQQCYIGIPPDHPWKDVNARGGDTVEYPFPIVHGGVSWSSGKPSAIRGTEYEVMDIKWIGWDYCHGPRIDRELGISYGIQATESLLTDEVIEVCEKAEEIYFPEEKFVKPAKH